VGIRETLIGAGIVGSVATLAALYLPGMRDIEEEAAGTPRPATAGT
jgi:hypothetical protein